MKKYVLVKDGQQIDFNEFEGTPPSLAPNKPQWKELVDPGSPSISSTQLVESSAGLVDDKWVISYTVRDKTADEIFEESWIDKNSSLRIKISVAEIKANQQLQGFVSQLILWWNLMKFTHEVDGEFAYFYCNKILPEHQSIVDAFDGFIVIESYNNQVE